MTAKQHYMTEPERFLLEGFLRAKKPIAWIAREMGFSRQTIYNEIKRGSYMHTCDWWDELRYSAQKGQDVQKRRSQNKGRGLAIGNDIRYANYLEAKMLGVQEDGTIDKRKRYSPAAALAAARAEGFTTSVCVGTLYNYITGGVFLKLCDADLLEKATRAPRKKRPPKIAHKNLPSIENRPQEINERKQSGHWEMDLIVGPQGSKPCVLTMTERVKREELAIRLPNRKAGTVRRALNRLERQTPDFQKRFQSITTDNGSEFMEYERLIRSVTQKGQRFQVYYCHSYAAWEKGSNENHNRMLRRWFPKGTDFTKVKQQELNEAIDWMNHYPRKILGWLSPAEAACEGPPRG